MMMRSPMMERKRRMCAVCGDKCQINVILKWQRTFDSKVFHVCLACAEANKVNAKSVAEKVTKTYTTVVTN
jgi:ssDNA-binding Zn-finger/Zn-ribbon topoisomerase 1